MIVNSAGAGKSVAPIPQGRTARLLHLLRQKPQTADDLDKVGLSLLDVADLARRGHVLYLGSYRVNSTGESA